VYGAHVGIGSAVMMAAPHLRQCRIDGMYHVEDDALVRLPRAFWASQVEDLRVRRAVRMEGVCTH
jgi:hypothetical protein